MALGGSASAGERPVLSEVPLAGSLREAVTERGTDQREGFAARVRSRGTWLLIERTESSLGDVVAGDQKIETSAIVARVFAERGWRLMATAWSPSAGATAQLEWSTGGGGGFTPFSPGLPVEMAKGTGGAEAGVLVRVDLRLATEQTARTGAAEFLIDLQLEQQ